MLTKETDESNLTSIGGKTITLFLLIFNLAFL